MIKVLKFGGASIKNAEAIENVFSIINTFKDRNRKLCVAIDITGKNEKIFTKKIDVLKNEVIVLKKYPTIFIIE